MLDDTSLRDKANGAKTGKVAHIGAAVTLGAKQDGWVQITVDGTGDIGWVPETAVDAGGAGPIVAAIDPQRFAESCVEQGLIDDVNPHYLLGVAKLRSNITGGTDGARIGPYRLTTDEWKEVTPPFIEGDIHSTNQQIGGFSLMAKKRMEALGGSPSPVDLYRAQWADAPADIEAKLKVALDATADLEADAEKAMLGAPAEPDADPPTPAGSFGGDASNLPISETAYNLILTAEVSSKAYYNKFLQRPEWPGGKSGITIGIGYDVGYCSADELKNDWKDLDAGMVAALMNVRGLKAGAAQAALPTVKGLVTVPFELAIDLHRKTVIPRWVGIVQKALANTDKLKPDSFGALVSLTFNRGAGCYVLSGDRYQEMREIKQCMQAQNFAAIPNLIRGMSRLWPGANERGLPIRREKEAKLFEAGLA